MRWFPGLALALSIIAVGLSTWTLLQADARAEAAFQRHEKALVVRYRPEIIRLCRDFKMKDPPDNVETFDELLAPPFNLLESLGK